jgi:lipopolysaccharide export system permease protein
MIGWTLARYLAWRFLQTILAIFMTIFCLMFVIGFVELLRRTGDNPSVSAGTVALMSMMRTPYSAEAILPFAVLFGAMATFVDLTRKLELVVARAAGVSVWQFLAPSVVAAFLLGIASVALYNPVSATLKQRSDDMEFSLFGVAGSVKNDHGVWLREHSVDGLSIIHAINAEKGLTELSQVSVNVYAPDGSFLERIESTRAELQPGAWLMHDAHVSVPGEPVLIAPNYLLATDLTPEELAQSVAPPQGVPFWSLPGLTEKTRAAGLDASGYMLQFQRLLARPLLLVAMVLIAAAFSLRFFRFGGVARTLAGGVVAGFVLYIATEVFSDLGGAGTISPTLAAWSPALVGSMLGTLSLLHSEDG